MVTGTTDVTARGFPDMKATPCLNAEEIATWPLRVLGHEIELSGSAELLLPLAMQDDETTSP